MPKLQVPFYNSVSPGTSKKFTFCSGQWVIKPGFAGWRETGHKLQLHYGKLVSAHENKTT